MINCEVNKYYLNQILDGYNVLMYKAEFNAIKEYLKSINMQLSSRFEAKESSNKDNLLLCRLL